MSSLESNKNLAGIGAILLALGLIPGFGVVIGIIGAILLMIGIKGIAQNYNDHTIYQNTLWGIIFVVIAIISVAVALSALIWGSIFSGLAAVSSARAGLGIAIGVLLLILAVVVAFVFYLLASMYFRRAFSSLAQKSGEHMFETAGLVLLIGAILTIVFFGLLLVFIGWILAAVAFFSIKTPAQTYGYNPPPLTSSPPTSATTRFCPNCGAPVNAEAAFCPHCGKQLT